MIKMTRDVYKMPNKMAKHKKENKKSNLSNSERDIDNVLVIRPSVE